MKPSNLILITCLLIGTLLCAFAIRDWQISKPPLAIQFDERKLAIGHVGILETHELAIIAKNPNLHTNGWIIGSSPNVCGIDGCFYGLNPTSGEVRPRSGVEFKVSFKSPPVPGPFEKEFIIYSATNTLNEHKLKITGVAVAPKKMDSENQDSKDTKEKPEEQPHVSHQDS